MSLRGIFLGGFPKDSSCPSLFVMPHHPNQLPHPSMARHGAASRGNTANGQTKGPARHGTALVLAPKDLLRKRGRIRPLWTDHHWRKAETGRQTYFSRGQAETLEGVGPVSKSQRKLRRKEEKWENEKARRRAREDLTSDPK